MVTDYFKPEWDLDRGGAELVEMYKKIGFTEEMFRGRHTNRLKQIQYLKEKNILDDQLRMK